MAQSGGDTGDDFKRQNGGVVEEGIELMHRGSFNFTAVTLIAVVLTLGPVSCGWLKEPCGYHKDFIVLKEDAKSKRVFVQSTEERTKDLVYTLLLIEEIDSFISSCRPEWIDDYAVSFFTDPKYAGYQDDESVQPFILDGTWEKSYLAEFDKSVTTLTRFPMDPKRTQVDKVNF